MIYQCIALLFLSTAVAGQDCGGNLDIACSLDTECATFGATVKCVKAAPTDVLGCCDVPTTTTAAVTTTAASASATTTASCVDLLNPLTGVSDCPARSSLCSNSVYLEVMRVQCRRTCGFCTNSTSTNSTTCRDLTNPSTGVSDCPSMRSYCNNTIYNALMRIQCPSTCGFCTSG